MLSTRELQAHLERLSYKPGWEFIVYEGAWEGQHLAITVELPDSATDGTITLDVHSALPPMPSLNYFERWLCWRICRIETHEAREFFKRDGWSVFNPHAEFADRDLVR